MTELYRHLGADTDVPAGDIGVGGREVGYMAGMMKKLSNNTACVFTGKGLSFGGSLIRPEATGYGLVYFTQAMLERHGMSFDGMRVAVSGSGNVAQYTIEKCLSLGAKVITASDSSGTVVDEDGFTAEKLARLTEIKDRYGRVEEYAKEFGLVYLKDQTPWAVPVDIALPCATQNELDLADAEVLIKNGVKAVAEGANMPTTIPQPMPSWRQMSCLHRAKQRMRAAWQHPAWKCHRTLSVSAGNVKWWMSVCITSCWISTMHALSTAVRKNRPTMCRVRISPAS